MLAVTLLLLLLVGVALGAYLISGAGLRGGDQPVTILVEQGDTLSSVAGKLEEAGVIKSALVLHGYVTTCASTISQKAALAAWSDEAAEARAGHRRIFRERRDHLLELLESDLRLRAVTPDGAFYTMVDVGRYGASMKVAEAMLAQGVITVPGSAFGSESEGYLRLSFCAERAALTEGIRRMKEALEQMPDSGC